MDISKSVEFNEGITQILQMKMVGLEKDGGNHLREFAFPKNGIENGELSLGTENNGENGNPQCESLKNVAENVKLGEKECGGAERNCDLHGVLSAIGVPFVLGGDSTNDFNGNCRRNRGSDIAQNNERKKTQKVKEDMEDPDWSPQEMGRSGSKKSRQKSNQIGKKSWVNSLGEGNDVNVPKPEIQVPTPNKLKEILLSSGWMVVSWDGSGSAVYVSPSDSSYRSLSQAMDAFSQGNSNFGNQEWYLFPLIGNEEQKRDSESLSSDLCSNVGKFGDVEDVQKKKRGPVKKTKILSELTMSTEDVLLQRKQELDKDISMEGIGSRELYDSVVSCTVLEKKKSCIKGECLSPETEKSDCFTIEVSKINQSSKSDMHPGGPGLRRSSRLNGKHVPVDCEFDIEGEFYDAYIARCSTTESSLLPDKMGLGEVHRVSESCIVVEKATSCIKDACLNNETEKSSCCKMEVIQIDQSSSNGMHHADELLEVRKRKEPDDSCLASSSCISTESSVVPEEMEHREVHELVGSFLSNEKAKSCNKEECSSHETKSLDSCTEEVEAHNSSSCKMEAGVDLEYCEVEAVKIEQNSKRNMHQYDKSLGVRRSPRLNKKHIPVDSELAMEMRPYDSCLHSFECMVIEVAENGMEKPMNSTIEAEKMECESLKLGEVSVKQITGTDCEKVENQKQLESNGILLKHDSQFTESDGLKTPVSDKCSLSLNKSGSETPVSEKRSPSSMSKRKAVRRGKSNGKKKRKRSGGCGLMVRRPVKGEYRETLLSETKVTMLSWLIDAGMLTENERVVYKRNNYKLRTFKGWLTRGGIRCNCCKKVVTLLEFEAHSGSDLQQPWKNTCLSSGKSLMQCWTEAWEREKKQRKVGFQMIGINDPDPTDDACGVCADGGSLICCDNCPSTFHQDCLMLKSLPEGNWYCPYCRCAFCMMTEQGQDKASGSFALFTCNQCGCRYHRECAWGHDMLMMGLESSSFCGKICKKVAAGLSDILGVSNPIRDGFSWTLLKRIDEDQGIGSDQMGSFIMECNMKLSLALSVLDECFDTLLDPRTGLDMISQAIYNCGSNYSRLNCERFHTVILEKNGEIISVATLRIHGTNLAEMPFIGTRPIYRRQGMCRRLLKAIEEILSSLHVEKLIIPAIPDLLETWMTSFSFKSLELSHKEEIRNLSMMVFAETTLLQKPMCNTIMEDERGDVAPDSQVLLKLSPECILHEYQEPILPA